MTPQEIQYLFDYNGWANRRSIEGAAQLSDEQFIKPLGSSFPSVRDTLLHICSGEWVSLTLTQPSVADTSAAEADRPRHSLTFRISRRSRRCART